MSDAPPLRVEVLRGHGHGAAVARAAGARVVGHLVWHDGAGYDEHHIPERRLFGAFYPGSDYAAAARAFAGYLARAREAVSDDAASAGYVPEGGRGGDDPRARNLDCARRSGAAVACYGHAYGGARPEWLVPLEAWGAGAAYPGVAEFMAALASAPPPAPI